jgi:hypothetical protein
MSDREISSAAAAAQPIKVKSSHNAGADWFENSSFVNRETQNGFQQ